MKNRLLALAIISLLVLGVIAFLFVIRRSPREEALSERAITEVQKRVAPNAAFDSVAVPGSESFGETLCAAPYDWDHSAGVIEFVTLNSPSTQRVELRFCVNTDTWQIRFDNDLARVYMVDKTRYFNAKSSCFRLTDEKNKARDRLLIANFGETFLRVIPSSEDSEARDFSCTSIFELKDSPPAIWKLWPNSSPIPALIPDTPFTEPAKKVEKELEARKNNQCQPISEELGEDRHDRVQMTFGTSPELRITTSGYDRDDPNLICYFTYWDGADRMAPVATWSALANLGDRKIKAEDEGAKQIDHHN